MIKKTFIFLVLLNCFQLIAQEKSDYTPKIDGTIRGKYEYFTESDEHRFQIRNARFSVRGNISPIAAYKAEIDLSDEGKTRMLDAYVKLQTLDWCSFTIGQQKVPFSTDNLRSPYQYYFANRSFMGKQLTNLRDVGISFNFWNERAVPFNLTLGIYNGLGLYTQDKTLQLKELSYATRMVLFPDKPVQFSLNANTISPDSIRMTYYNAGISFEYQDFHFETEYLLKTYSKNNLLENNYTTGYLMMAKYDIKTPKMQNITKISPVLRYEGMTKNLKYDVQNSSTIAMKIDEARNRISGGLIISLNKPFINDIRLNYEHYIWEDGSHADSKFVAEFVVKF
ncbi:MAG: porin [Paludibacter sp.]|nr:porin [Paludibacter sp.]MDD4198285.1 porin [Paludibacter sp.]MDD4426979.1 porin [Paludibacter sp.]